MPHKDYGKLLAELEYHRDAHDLVAHDLNGPLAFLVNISHLSEPPLKLIEKLSQGNQEIVQAIFDLRRIITSVENKSGRVTNTANALVLSDISPEELAKVRRKFSPYKTLNSDMASYEHEMLGRKLGFNLAYSQEVKNLKLHTNESALSTVFSNLIGNAVKYAYNASVIKSLVYCEDGKLVFELENMVKKPIDDRGLMYIFEKGHREHLGDLEDQMDIGTNQGLGLYFVNRIVRNGFLGDITVKSSNSFYITEARTKGLDQKNYGVNYPPSFKRFPSFHTRVSIPLENILERPSQINPILAEVFGIQD